MYSFLFLVDSGVSRRDSPFLVRIYISDGFGIGARGSRVKTGNRGWGVIWKSGGTVEGLIPLYSELLEFIRFEEKEKKPRNEAS